MNDSDHKVYDWKNVFQNDAESVTISPRMNGDFLAPFTMGARIQNDYLINFDISRNQSGKNYHLLANNLGWYLVSNDLRKTLEKFKGFRFCNDEKLDGYHLLVPTNNLASVVDPEASEGRIKIKEDGRLVISSLEKIAVKKSCLNYDSFSIVEFPVSIFISELLKMAVSEVFPIMCTEVDVV